MAISALTSIFVGGTLTAGTTAATVIGIAGTAINGAIIGAAVGGITSAVMGGDIGKGMLYGAVGGAVTGGIMGYLNPIGTPTAAMNVGSVGADGIVQSGYGHGLTAASGGGGAAGGGGGGTSGSILSKIGDKIGEKGIAAGIEGGLGFAGDVFSGMGAEEAAKAELAFKEQQAELNREHEKEITKLQSGLAKGNMPIDHFAEELAQRKKEFNETMKWNREQFYTEINEAKARREEYAKGLGTFGGVKKMKDPDANQPGLFDSLFANNAGAINDAKKPFTSQPVDPEGPADAGLITGESNTNRATAGVRDNYVEVADRVDTQRPDEERGA